MVVLFLKIVLGLKLDNRIAGVLFLGLCAGYILLYLARRDVPKAFYFEVFKNKVFKIALKEYELVGEKVGEEKIEFICKNEVLNKLSPFELETVERRFKNGRRRSDKKEVGRKEVITAERVGDGRSEQRGDDRVIQEGAGNIIT